MARVFGWLYCSWLLFSTLQFLRWGGGQVIGSNSTGRGRGGRGRRKNFNIRSLLFELSLFYCQNLSAYGFPNSWPPSWLNGLLSKKTPTLFQWENILQNAEVCGHLRRNIYYCEHHSKYTLSPLCKYSLNSATYSKVCEFFVWSEIGKPLCFLCETIKITRWNYITTLKEKNHKILNVESYLLGMKWVNLWGKLTLIHKIWQNWSK